MLQRMLAGRVALRLAALAVVGVLSPACAEPAPDTDLASMDASTPPQPDVAPLPAEGMAAIAQDAARAGNFAEAYCLWRTLAEEGDSDAQYNLGWLYHNGYGLTIDDARAAQWWQMAGAQGHADALFALANLYRFGGRGFDKDNIRAADLLLAAARQGEDEAGLLLRTLIGRNDASLAARAAELLMNESAVLGGALQVSADRLNLRAGAGLDHRILAVARKGERLIELRRRGDWVQVGLPADGRIAWASAKLLAPASPQ